MTATLTQNTTLETIQQKANEIARFLGAQEAEFLYELNGKAKFEIHLGEMSIGMCFPGNGRIVVYALGWPRVTNVPTDGDECPDSNAVRTLD
jgi:dihydroxyacetone kinase